MYTFRLDHFPPLYPIRFVPFPFEFTLFSNDPLDRPPPSWTSFLFSLGQSMARVFAPFQFICSPLLHFAIVDWSISKTHLGLLLFFSPPFLFYSIFGILSPLQGFYPGFPLKNSLFHFVFFCFWVFGWWCFLGWGWWWCFLWVCFGGGGFLQMTIPPFRPPSSFFLTPKKVSSH